MIDLDRSRFSTVTVGSDTFILDAETGETFRIGGAGSRLWELLLAGKTPPEAARVVAEQSRAPYEQVLEDTMAFIEGLRARGIVPAPPHG